MDKETVVSNAVWSSKNALKIFTINIDAKRRSALSEELSAEYKEKNNNYINQNKRTSPKMPLSQPDQ